MPSHFHLLVKTRNQPLSTNMRKLLTGYVVNFNKRHRRHGHFFQNRYKSIVCQEDLYYVKKGIPAGRRPELVGGGLIRSSGGWSEVLAIRKRGEKQAFDQRILGDSEFIQEIRTGLDDLVKRNLRLSGQRVDLETLARKVCKIYTHRCLSFNLVADGMRRSRGPSE